MVNLPSKSEGGLEVNPAYVEQRIQEAMETGEADEYEVGYHRLELKRVLGKGAFGKVFLAEAYGLGESQDTTTLVAVKVLNGEFPRLLLCFGLACERRRISGRLLSPPEKYHLRTRAAKRFLWRKTFCFEIDQSDQGIE